jgi:hypothetical protein
MTLIHDHHHPNITKTCDPISRLKNLYAGCVACHRMLFASVAVYAEFRMKYLRI